MQPVSVKRPQRGSYASEPDYLLACLRYLDAKFPGREGQRKRIAAFRRWERETADDDRLRERIRELIERDEWSASDADEWGHLIVAWLARKADPRLRKKETK